MSKSNIHEIVHIIDKKEWKELVDNEYKKLMKNAKVDGFRKGHVPKHIIEKNYGKEYVLYQAANSVMEKAYFDCLMKNKLVPIISPKADIKDISEEKVEFLFTITTKPEVKIKKYKGLKVEKEKVKVTKKEVQEEIDKLLERYSELVVKEGKIENGDIAIIDYEGFKDGEAFAGGKAENYSLTIGSNTFIPGFEEGLIGLKAGDKKDLNLEFPKDYNAEDLAGKKVVFKVVVNEVKEKVKRKLDKELFEDLNIDGVDSKEKLEEKIETSLKANKELEAENNYVERLLEEVGKNVEVDIPDEVVKEELEHLKENMEQNMKRQGLSLELYLKFTGSTIDALEKELEPEAYSNVLYRYMLEEIIRLEKIELKEKELDTEIDKFAKEYKITKEEVINQFGGKEVVKNNFTVRKAIELLKEFNK